MPITPTPIPTPVEPDATTAAQSALPQPGQPAPTSPMVKSLLGSPATGAPVQPKPTDLSGQQLTPPAKPPAIVPIHRSLLQKLGSDASKWAGLQAVKSLMGGDTTPGAPGQPPRKKPGALFRNILASALVGGAAAEEAHSRNPYMGFGGGLAVGAGTAVENAQRQRAQQQAINLQKQQEADRQNAETAKENQADRMFKLQTYHYSNEELLSAANLNLENQKEIATENAQSNMLLSDVLKEHGTLVNLPQNGVPGNGASLMQLFTKQPKLLQATPGTSRVAIKTVNTDGLTFDALDHGWKDSTGKPVNLEAVTTWHIYDIPNEKANQTVPLTGKQLKSLFPVALQGSTISDDSTYSLPIGTLLSLGSKERGQARIARNAEITSQRDTLNGKARIVAGELAGVRAQLASVPKQLLDKDGLPTGTPNPEAVKYRQQITALNSQLNDLMSDVNPYMKGQAWAKHPAIQQYQLGRKGGKQIASSLTVRMLDSKGNSYNVRGNQVKAAKAQGWTIAE